MAHEPLTSPPPDAAAEPPPSRRSVIGLSSTALMLAGLIGGYGFFAWLSARFMLPARIGAVRRLFVARVGDLAEGRTLLYQTPDGRTVNITRRASAGSVDDFIALSSTCPHLGCQVRWEAQNNRYFCPCHNGIFDPTGRATGGPPGDAGQSLPRYDLSMDKGLLYIDVSVEQLSVPVQAGLVHLASPQGPGHDPCLSHLERGAAPAAREGLA
jgi:nitrite reductase/ring-hydroxylating ferredoxin subunit